MKKSCATCTHTCEKRVMKLWHNKECPDWQKPKSSGAKEPKPAQSIEMFEVNKEKILKLEQRWIATFPNNETHGKCRNQCVLALSELKKILLVDAENEIKGLMENLSKELNQKYILIDNLAAKDAKIAALEKEIAELKEELDETEKCWKNNESVLNADISELYEKCCQLRSEKGDGK